MEGTTSSAGGVENTEVCLDIAALVIVREEAVREAAKWVVESWPELRTIGIMVHHREHHFELQWWPAGERYFLQQDFDLEGHPVGEIRLTH